MDQQPGAAVVVLAGGSGRRMAATMANIEVGGGSPAGGGTPANKVFLPLGARSILEFSLLTADQCDLVADIVLVVRPEDEDEATLLLDRLDLSRPVRLTRGGATRQDSEYAGLNALRDKIVSGTTRVVSIHDGARPFVSLGLLEATINTAQRVGGAIPGLPLPETLYQLASTEPNRVVALSPTSLRRVQTPQTFRAQPLLLAYDQAATTGFQGVDTAETVERFTEVEVRVVPGDPANIKVTFADDMTVAEQYAAMWQPGGIFS